MSLSSFSGADPCTTFVEMRAALAATGGHDSREWKTPAFQTGLALPMEDWSGQAWTAPGLLGSLWCSQARPRDWRSGSTLLRACPDAATDPHTLAWLLAGTVRPAELWSRQDQDVEEASDSGRDAWRATLTACLAKLPPEARRATETLAAGHLREEAQKGLLGEANGSLLPDRAIEKWGTWGWSRLVVPEGGLGEDDGRGPWTALAARVVAQQVAYVHRTGTRLDMMLEWLLLPGQPMATPSPARHAALASAALHIGDLQALAALERHAGAQGSLSGTLGLEWRMRHLAALSLGLRALEMQPALSLDAPLETALATWQGRWSEVLDALPFRDRLEVRRAAAAFGDRVGAQVSRIEALRMDRDWPAAPRAPSGPRL